MSKYDVKDFELKLGLSLLGGSIILTGAKLYDMNKRNSEGEINIIKDFLHLYSFAILVRHSKNRTIPNRTIFRLLMMHQKILLNY